jgi:hypothetical protein
LTICRFIASSVCGNITEVEIGMLKINMNNDYEVFELAFQVMNGREPTPKQAERLRLWLTLGKPSLEEWIEAVTGRGRK